VRPVRVTKRPKKKERQRQKPNNGKLGKLIRRDNPRHWIEMKFCVVGGLQMIVLIFEFHQNLLNGFGAVGVEICPSHWLGHWLIQQLVLPYKPYRTSRDQVTFDLSVTCLTLVVQDAAFIFSERELTQVHVRYLLSPVRLSVVCLSVTLVHPTQAVVNFGNFSTAFGTLAIHCWPSCINLSKPICKYLLRLQTLLMRVKCLDI